MKKKLSLLLAIIFIFTSLSFIGLNLAVKVETSALSSTKWVKKIKPVLDGKMDESYKGSYKTDLYNQYLGGIKLTPGKIWLKETAAGVTTWAEDITETSSITAFTYMLWDGTYLYVFTQVNDKNVIKVPISHFNNGNDITGPKGIAYHAPAIENFFAFTHEGYNGVIVKTRVEAYGRSAYAWHDPAFTTSNDYKTIVTPGVGYSVEYRTALGKLKDDQIFSATLALTHLNADGSMIGLGTEDSMDLNGGFKLAKDTTGIKNGWYTESSKDVFYVNGQKVVNQIKEIGTGVKYFFDQNGYLKTGLQTGPDGNKYLFDTTTGRSKFGVQNINATDKAYFGKNGYMEKNLFVDWENNWYYAGTDGILIKSTSKVFNGVTIEFGRTGIIKNGFYDINIAKGGAVSSSSASKSVTASSGAGSNALSSSAVSSSTVSGESSVDNSGQTSGEVSSVNDSSQMSNVSDSSADTNSNNSSDGGTKKSATPLIIVIGALVLLTAVGAGIYFGILKNKK